MTVLVLRSHGQVLRSIPISNGIDGTVCRQFTLGLGARGRRACYLIRGVAIGSNTTSITPTN